MAVLHSDILSFYRRRMLLVKAILSDDGRELCGRICYLYQLYLDFNGMEHRRTQEGRPQTNGFVESFNRAFQDEFLRL